METRSLKTGLAKPFVWQHSQLWRNDNKQIRILLPKMSWLRLRNKCCRAGGVRNRNSRPGTRTTVYHLTGVVSPSAWAVFKRKKRVSHNDSQFILFKFVNSLLSGSFLIKFSSLSAPTNYAWTDLNPASFVGRCVLEDKGNPGQLVVEKELTAWWKSRIHTQFPLWLRSSVVRACNYNSQDPGFDSRRGCTVFFRLIWLSVLLSLSELKENGTSFQVHSFPCKIIRA